MIGNELETHRTHADLRNAEEVLIGSHGHHRLSGHAVDPQVGGIHTPNGFIEKHLDRGERSHHRSLGRQDPGDAGRLLIQLTLQFGVEHQVAAGQIGIEHLDGQHVEPRLEHLGWQGHRMIFKLHRFDRSSRGH